MYHYFIHVYFLLYIFKYCIPGSDSVENIVFLAVITQTSLT